MNAKPSRMRSRYELAVIGAMNALAVISSFMASSDTRHPLEQRGRRLKRTLLRPVGAAALRWGQGRGPIAVRDLALRKLALPYFRARDEWFERPVGDGVFVGRTADMLSLYVLAFGVWEPHLSAFIRGRLGDGDVFVDVGANAGWYTLLGSRAVGVGGVVVAIEASSVIAERLRRQISENNLANVRVGEEA